MKIDSHMHMWNRKMLPDEAIRNYMDPIKEFKKLYGDVMDFGLDDEMPFDDYDVPINEPIESLVANNIDKGIVLATDFELVGGNRMTVEEYHEWLFQRCSTCERFVPFISVDPNRGADALKKIEFFVNKYAPLGIKMYPAVGFYPDDPKMKPYWDMVDQYGLVIVTHAGMALPPLDERYCHPSNLAGVAESYPDMKIVVAHLGGKFHDEMFQLMDAHENVYTDCSALQGWVPEDKSMVNRRLGEFMTRYPERVVFGTDFPLYDSQTSTMQFTRLIMEGDWGNDTVKEDLLGNNMARVLGLR